MKLVLSRQEQLVKEREETLLERELGGGPMALLAWRKKQMVKQKSKQTGNPGGPKEGEPPRCFKCGDLGHKKYACPMNKVPLKGPCFACGGMGHISMDCPNKGAGGSNKDGQQGALF